MENIESSFFSYLTKDLYDEPISKKDITYNKDNSVTYELSFMYTPEDEDEEIEVYFLVTCKPLDAKKKFVNLSFDYPDPDNIHDETLLVAKDKYEAVKNTQEDIIEKCMKFIDEVYGVDTIEKLPENITAHKRIASAPIEAAFGDILKAFLSDLADPTSGEYTTEYEITKNYKDGRNLKYDIAMYVLKDGEDIVKFPEELTILPEEEDKITLQLMMPDPDNLDELKLMDSKEKIDNSKQYTKKYVLNSFYANQEKYDMKKFMKKFATNPDTFDFTKTSDTSEVAEETGTSEEDIDIGESEDIMKENTPITGNTMRVSLQKVKSSTGYNIELTNILASYSPTKALVDLDALVADDTFIDTLTYDEPLTYDVVVSEDAFDVEPVPASDLDIYAEDCRKNSYDAILDCAYILYLDVKYLSCVASGSELTTIQNYADNYCWRIQDLIDTTSKMILEDKYPLKHPINRITELGNGGLVDKPGHTVQFATWNEFTSIIKQDIEPLVAALSLYSCNFEEDKAHMFDGWARTWKFELDYVLDRASK